MEICCCCELRVGCIFAAAWTLLTAMVCFVWSLLAMSTDWAYHFGVPMLMLLASFALVIGAACLFIGITKEKLTLLLVWLCIYCVFAIYRLFLVVCGLFGLGQWGDLFGAFSGPWCLLLIMIIFFLISFLIDIWAIFCVLAFRRALSLPENYRVVGGPYTDDPALRRRMEQNMDFIRKPDGMVI